MSDRLALIIANGKFDDPRLTRLATPVHDAAALARTLSDPAIGGFEVTLLVDKTLGIVRREIARLYQRRKRSDLLLLYYSGHGIKDDFGDLYLAVHDTESEVLSATALDAAFVRAQLDKSSSQRKVVVLDCCHSGAFARGGKAVLGSSVGAGEAFAGSGYGRVILTASNALEYAWEGDELLGQAETSVFTRFLVQGLRTGAADLDSNGKISIDELYDYTHEQVVTGGSKQTPQKWAQKVEGQIIIAQNPHRVVRPAGLSPELRQAVESPFAGLREGAVRELERLLHSSDEGLALAAQQALERLAADDSRRVSAAAARALRIFLKPVTHEPSPPLPLPVVAEQVKAEVVREPRKLGTLLDKYKAWGWIASAGLVALAMIVVIFLLTRGAGEDGKPTNTPATAATATPIATATPQPAATPTIGIDMIMTRESDGAVMVYVPAGEFLMGSAEDDPYADDNEKPQRTVYVEGFWIDKTEVTNDQYRLCVEAEACRAPECGWGGPTYNDVLKGDYPVACVLLEDAQDYCAWAGVRLPTQTEWEKAGRGTDGRIYPWGNSVPDCDKAQYSDCGGLTVPVGSKPAGASPYGALDMVGNVWEWVADWYNAGYYINSPPSGTPGPESGLTWILRGGSGRSSPYRIRSAIRDWGDTAFGLADVGFRCAMTPTSSP